MFKKYDVSGEEEGEEEELPVVCAAVRLRSCLPVERSSKAIVIHKKKTFTQTLKKSKLI